MSWLNVFQFEGFLDSWGPVATDIMHEGSGKWKETSDNIMGDIDILEVMLNEMKHDRLMHEGTEMLCIEVPECDHLHVIMRELPIWSVIYLCPVLAVKCVKYVVWMVLWQELILIIWNIVGIWYSYNNSF